MATHVVELVIQRFYRVYVDDKDDSMTNEQAVEKAKQMAVESEDNLSEDLDLDIEPEDITHAFWEYDI